MKQYVRYALYGVLIFLSLMLWDAWQAEHQPKPTPTDVNVSSSTNSAASPGNYNVPTGLNHANERIKNMAAHPIQTPKERMITVKTNVFNLKIDTLGGNVVQTELLGYPQSLADKQPVLLLSNEPDTLYVAQSGLFSATNHELLSFESPQTEYNCFGDKTLKVTLKGHTSDGLLVEKIYTFTPRDYSIQLAFDIKNDSSKPWTGSYFTQFTRNSLIGKQSHFMSANSFFGAALSSPENPYQKIQFDKLSTEPVSQNTANGWLAMIQHYFVSAWVPNKDITYHYYSSRNAEGICTLGMVSPEVSLNAGQTTQFTSTLYVGPKITDALKKVAPHLELTVDYGKLWPIAILLFKVLQFVNRFLGNWGWSIIAITILIKLAFYKLSEVTFRSTANMRKLQPKIAQLKEQYGNDKQAMSKAMMELYKREKINPLAGCLPTLVQIPVFFALYVVLLESIELRQAPFIFWLKDLSLKDPYYILPVIMGISMYFQQKLTPTPTTDETQAKMMAFMPVFMTVLFLSFPSGLVLYWLVNNLLTILQQSYIIKKVDRGDFDKKNKKGSRLTSWLSKNGKRNY